MEINKYSKIYVAGHRGMVGSAVCRALKAEGYKNIFTMTRTALDLCNQLEVYRYFQMTKPDVVIMCAAKVGGIHANNTSRADFIFTNLQIECNVIHGAHLADCNNMIFLGSSCIYPKMSDQPIREEYLLSGKLEPTNEPYAIAKIAGVKMCEAYAQQYDRNYMSLMPTNLYGPNDNYDFETSHVLPALLRKFHDAKVNGDPIVTVWGTGTPRREFLHVDDLASCITKILEDGINAGWMYNVGTGEDIELGELAKMIKDIVGYDGGTIVFDSSKPDGTMRKLLDVGLIKSTGWSPQIELRDGIEKVYAEVLKLW